MPQSDYRIHTPTLSSRDQTRQIAVSIIASGRFIARGEMQYDVMMMQADDNAAANFGALQVIQGCRSGSNTTAARLTDTT
jgi:hypothetical protein